MHCCITKTWLQIALVTVQRSTRLSNDTQNTLGQKLDFVALNSQPYTPLSEEHIIKCKTAKFSSLEKISDKIIWRLLYNRVTIIWTLTSIKGLCIRKTTSAREVMRLDSHSVNPSQYGHQHSHIIQETWQLSTCSHSTNNHPHLSNQKPCEGSICCNTSTNAKAATKYQAYKKSVEGNMLQHNHAHYIIVWNI